MYTPMWLNRAWKRKNGFKGKTKKHSVNYNWDEDTRYVNLEGKFDREDLMSLAYELTITYALKGEFGEPKTYDEAIDILANLNSDRA